MQIVDRETPQAVEPEFQPRSALIIHGRASSSSILLRPASTL